MASPLRRPHGRSQPVLSGLLWLYENSTPGIEVLDNATTILGKESEPQPDLGLRILTEFGGQSRVNADDYIVGAPELLAEIAHSTRALDLHRKKDDYQQAGVAEYLVHCLEEKELHWFDFRAGGRIEPDSKGVHRSRVFPGLWLDGPALMERRSAQVIRVLKRGLASPEHAQFCKHLQAARRKHRGGAR